MGLGLGCVLQVPNIAVQTVLPKDQVAIGISLLAFVQFLGGSIFVTVCQNLLQNKLVEGLLDKIPNFDPAAVSGQGATDFRNLVSADELPLVLDVYNGSLKSIWYVGLGLSCLILLGSLGFEFRSVKKQKTTKITEV